MRILIVGGFGYVGGRLTRYLSEHHGSYDIAVSTTKDTVPSWADRIRVFKLDLRSVITIQECLNRFKPELIIHLGAVNQHYCQNNPEEAHRINVEGTQNLCNEAFKVNVKKIVYVSTFQVYGRFEGDITEDQQAIPDSTKFYPLTKKKAEDVILNSPIPSAIIRLSNAYGYPMPGCAADHIWTLAMNAFALNCIKQDVLAPRDNVYRDFISMADVVKGIAHIALDISNQKKNEIYNLGGENTLSITEAANEVACVYKQEFGKSVQLVLPQDNQHAYFTYNITKLKNTGFNLDGKRDELLKTLKYLKENKG